MPLQNHEFQRIMRECILLRNHNCTSFLELEIYFQFMHQTIIEKDNLFSCGSKVTSREFFHKFFFKAFENLSQLEAAKYYLHMLNFVHMYVDCPKSKTGHSSVIFENHEPRSKQYAVDIIKKGFFLNTQKVHYLQIDRKKSVLLIKSPKNPYDLELNLENYLVRQSKRNEKGKAYKEFLILKAGGQPTPDEIRFAMKDVYQFPQMFGELWSFILQLHSQKLKEIIDKLSEGGSKKGYVEIVLFESQQALGQLSGSRKQLKPALSEQRSVEEFSYLDMNHPVSKVSQIVCTKMGEKEVEPTGHFVWGNQWEKTPKGYLKNVNFKYISVQRSAVKKVIKSFMSMGNGESEMPIQMFGNESNLHQLARSCRYFSYFFDKKKQNCHEVERIIVDAFKKTFCSIIGFLLIRNRMEKPIQPFLGQTYQGFIDGYPISLEQIGKNQSYVLFQTDEIKLYGCLELSTGISGLNSISAGSKGFLTLELIRYKRTPKILFTIPMIQLSGLLYGDRLVQISDTSVIYEEESKTICHLIWGKSKNQSSIKKQIRERQDFVQGQVFMLKSDKKFQIKKFIENKQYIKDFAKEKSIEKSFGHLYGNWTSEIYFEDKQKKSEIIFKIDHEKPGSLFNYVQPLPSDGRLRKDIRLLESDKITEAQNERKRIEQIEQKESKMRLGYKNR